MLKGDACKRNEKTNIMLAWALPQCLRIPFKEPEQPQFSSYILVGLYFLVKKTKATIKMEKHQINDKTLTAMINQQKWMRKHHMATQTQIR